MRWELAWTLALGCCACGQSNANAVNTSPGGAASSGAGEGGGAGQGSGGGTATPSAGAGNGRGGSSGAGSGVGLCSGSTNQAGGTRLKGRFWITAEGDRGWDTLWDTQLNQACDFKPGTDGKQHCLPDSYDLSAEVFTESTCTQAAYTRMKIAACTSTDYIMQFVTGSCDKPGGYAFYALGAMVTPAPTTTFVKVGDTCMLGPPLSEALYAKGAEVSPSMFMEGTSTQFDAATRIRTWGVLGADGTRSVWGWADNQLEGEHCHFEKAEDGKVRCLASSALWGGYSDASCTSPLLLASPTCDQEVGNHVMQSPSYQCLDDPHRVFKRGEPFTGTPYDGDPSACRVGASPSSTQAYLTTPVAPEQFQEVVSTIDESDPGRLKPHYYDAGANGCWFDDFWDSELNTPCFFASAADHQQRCLPNEPSYADHLFADPECKGREAFAPVADCAVPAAPPAYVTRIAEACDRSFNVWKVGASVTKAELPPVYWNPGGGCVATTPTQEKFLKLSIVEPALFMAAELKLE